MPFQAGQGVIDTSPVSDALGAIAESIQRPDPLRKLRRWWAAADPDQRRELMAEVSDDGECTPPER